LRAIVVIIIVFILISCAFEPWKTIQYINLETENIGPYGFDSLPDEVQYGKHYLNGAFIIIGAKGKDATVYKSEEPYNLFIHLTGKTDEHIYYSIDNIRIISSNGIDYTELISDLPITINFETIETIPKTVNYVRGFYSTDYVFNFSDEKIFISFLLEVTTIESKEKNEVFFTLTKITKRGLFQSYW